jgi:hypothetical protein
MSGTKGHSGGPRPGSGSKPQWVQQAQTTNRQIMLAVVKPSDIEEIAMAMINKAKAGDDKAFRAFMSYVLGAPDSQLTIKGDVNAPLVVEVCYVDAPSSDDDQEQDDDLAADEPQAA